MAIEEVDGILGIEGQPSVAGAAFPANGAGLSEQQALFEESLARERAAAANPALRYAFNDTAKQQETKTDAVEPQGKAGEPPRNAEPGWRDFLKDIRVPGGLIGLGAEGARQAADYAARHSEATEYYGPDLALRVYPQGQPGPNGAKAAFLRRGADGTETVLPVQVEPREDVHRYHMQPLKDAVRFDPAELGRAYDLSKLSASGRERLGLPPSASGDKTAAGQDRQGFSIETRDQEERDLVDSMLAQGKSADEIQNALSALRASRGTATGQAAAAHEADKPAAEFKDYNQAINAALGWLKARGFKAEAETIGKFGDNAGKPIGMKTADGRIGFRVEYDDRHGAHINVWSGKEKGPHFTFEGNQSTVDEIVKQFVKQK